MNQLKKWSLRTAALLLMAGASWAQTFPAKPITIIVPQAPGGANDVIARAIANKLGNRMGQVFVVENRAGAGGNVGTSFVARAPADGYTLLLTAQSAQTINPALYRKIPFDPVKDFAPIMTVATAPYLLAVNPSVPANNLRELIALAKANPAKLNIASAGNGTLNHLLAEMLKSAEGLQITHVPYKGAAAAATDLVGGQVQMTFGSFPGLMPFVRSGQLRALGVATAQRTPLAPELPTLAETVPSLEVNSWYGLFAPAGTPKAIVTRLQTEFAQVLQTPEMKDFMMTQGAVAAPSTPEELSKLLGEDLVRWAKIVKDANAQID
jgi:tripartite-type tricarboxylate transporter receptor subunit TctC